MSIRFWQINDHRNPAAEAAVLLERSKSHPMDEAATTAFFAELVAEGQAAEVLWMLTDRIVMREAEDAFVLVDNGFWCVLEELKQPRRI